MELVLGIALVSWIAGSLIVAGLCIAAARGDAALGPAAATVEPRAPV